MATIDRFGIPLRRAVHVFQREHQGADGKPEPVWFAFDEARPLAVFAGIWTGWTCTRKLAYGEITGELVAFLTTDPNQEVGTIHPKAMPVILTEAGEIETWLTLVYGRLRVAAPVAGWSPGDCGAWSQSGQRGGTSHSVLDHRCSPLASTGMGNGKSGGSCTVATPAGDMIAMSSSWKPTSSVADFPRKFSVGIGSG